MDREKLYTAALEGTLILTADGDWLHEGTSIQHPRIRDFLFRHIQWDEDTQRYQIRFGQGAATFTYQDTAWFVVELLDERSEPEIRLSDGTIEPLVVSSLKTGNESQIYCTVKNSHRARFNRSAYQRLALYAVDEYTIRIGGREVRLI